MKLKDFRKSVVETDSDGIIFDKIVKVLDIDQDITKKEIGKIIQLMQKNVSEIVRSYVKVYYEDILQWYLEDLKRLQYANDSISLMKSVDNVMDIFFAGQKLYWQEKINQMIVKMKSHLIEK